MLRAKARDQTARGRGLVTRRDHLIDCQGHKSDDRDQREEASGLDCRGRFDKKKRGLQSLQGSWEGRLSAPLQAKGKKLIKRKRLTIHNEVRITAEATPLTV